MSSVLALLFKMVLFHSCRPMKTTLLRSFALLPLRLKGNTCNISHEILLPLKCPQSSVDICINDSHCALPRPSENMLIRANTDGTYSANWTPGAVGLYTIHVTIDGIETGMEPWVSTLST